MGDEEYGQLAGQQKILQPADGIAVQIVGRLVEQQRLGRGHQQSRQLQFDALAAGKIGHALRAVKRVGRQRELRGQLAEVFRRLIEKRGRRAEKIVSAFFALVFRQFLRQIARAAAAGKRAGDVDIVAHGGVARQHAEQSGFAVALFTDERKAFAVADGEGERIDQNGQVFAMSERKVCNREHKTPILRLLLKSKKNRLRPLRPKAETLRKKRTLKKHAKTETARPDFRLAGQPKQARGKRALRLSIKNRNHLRMLRGSPLSKIPLSIAPSLKIVGQIVFFAMLTAPRFGVFNVDTFCRPQYNNSQC